MTSSTLAFGDAELLGEVGRELVDRRVALLGLRSSRISSQRGAQLGLADAELLGERVELASRAPRGRARAWRLPGAARAQVRSASRSFASVTPSFVARSLRSGGPPGRVRTSSSAARTLAASTPSSLRELVGERVADVAAVAVAAELAPALAVADALVERGLDLGLGDAELAGERLRERVAEVVERRALRSSRTARSAAMQLVLADAELLGGVGEASTRAAAEAAGAGPVAEAVAALARRRWRAAGERRAVARLAPERVGPGGEHEGAREGSRRLLGAWGHGRSIGTVLRVG